MGVVHVGALYFAILLALEARRVSSSESRALRIPLGSVVRRVTSRHCPSSRDEPWALSMLARFTGTRVSSLESARVTYVVGIVHTGVAAFIRFSMRLPWESRGFLAGGHCPQWRVLVVFLLSPLRSLVYCPFPLGIPCLACLA